MYVISQRAVTKKKHMIEKLLRNLSATLENIHCFFFFAKENSKRNGETKKKKKNIENKEL